LYGNGNINMDLTGAAPSRITAEGNVTVLGVTNMNLVSVAPNNQVLISASSGLGNAANFSLNMTGHSAALNATGTQIQLVAATAPVINNQPANQTVTAGQNATFSITATGNPAPTYQWQVSTNNGSSRITQTGVTSATVTLVNVETGHSGWQYRCVVTNPGGSVTSNAATLTVNAATQPALSGTVTISGFTGTPVFGQTLTAQTSQLTSTPAGTTPTGLTYQWRRGSTNININGTSATYTLAAADIGAAITVRVSASNCTGNVTSAATALVAKAAQTAAPAAPTQASRTATGITLNEIAGCEYNLDGGNWQTSATFSGLAQGTSYTFRARLAETPTHTASPASAAATLTTEGEPAAHVAVTGITGVPATAVAGTPLTLTATVAPANATRRTIVWTVKLQGTTGASIVQTGHAPSLHTTAAGTVVITATIAGGRTATDDYVQDFTITVTGGAMTSAPEIQPENPLKAWTNAGTLYITGIEAGKVWRLFGISGQLVQQGIAASDMVTVNLNAQGVYIVWTEGWSVKVAYSN
jgi:predicted secreted protein